MADVNVFQFTPLNKIESNADSANENDDIITKEEADKTANSIIAECLSTNRDTSSNPINQSNTEDIDLSLEAVDSSILVVKPSDENQDPSSPVRSQRGRKPKRKSTSSQSESAKKSFKGLRSDCPTFCRTGCTFIHHKLLVSARKMFENDSKSTLAFLEKVSAYYLEGDDGHPHKANELIYDPSKNTEYPLLHYLALMGKCSGCFALVDYGHDPKDMLTITNDCVLHTMVREMYNFNCTHGHMDILLKKFKLLLKEFHNCLLLSNNEKQTCLHLCASLVSINSGLLTSRKPPFRYYQFSKNMFKSLIEQFVENGHDKSLLNEVDNEGNTVAHYIASDRASKELLDELKNLNIDFSIKNKKGETVDDVISKAPSAPPEDMLKLAVFSSQSNKDKASSAMKLKYTPPPASKSSPNSKNGERGPNKRAIKKRNFGNEFLDEPKKMKFESKPEKVKSEKQEKKKTKGFGLKIKLSKTGSGKTAPVNGTIPAAESEKTSDDSFISESNSLDTSFDAGTSTPLPVQSAEEKSAVVRTSSSTVNKSPPKELLGKKSNVSPPKSLEKPKTSPPKTPSKSPDLKNKNQLSPAAKILRKFNAVNAVSDKMIIVTKSITVTPDTFVSSTSQSTLTTTIAPNISISSSLRNTLTSITPNICINSTPQNKRKAVNSNFQSTRTCSSGTATTQSNTVSRTPSQNSSNNITLSQYSSTVLTSKPSETIILMKPTNTTNKVAVPKKHLVKNPEGNLSYVNVVKPPKRILPAPLPEPPKENEPSVTMVTKIKEEKPPSPKTPTETMPLITNVKSLKEEALKESMNKTPAVSSSMLNIRPLLPKGATGPTLSIPDMSATKQLLNQSRPLRPPMNGSKQIMVRASNGHMVAVNLLEKAIADMPMQQQQQGFRFGQPVMRASPPQTMTPNQQQTMLPPPHQAQIFIAPNGMRYFVPPPPPGFIPNVSSGIPPPPYPLPPAALNSTPNSGARDGNSMRPHFRTYPHKYLPPQAQPIAPLPRIRGIEPRHILPVGHPSQLGNIPTSSEPLLVDTLSNCPKKNVEKSRNLEDRINMLMNKKGSEPLSPREREELEQLSSKIDQSAPPVIILDGEDGDDQSMTDENVNTKVEHTSNMKTSPVQESTSQQHMNGTLFSSERNLIEQKEYNSRRESLLWNIETDRNSMSVINDEILRIENLVVSTQEMISVKEKEIKVLKSQVKSSQEQSKKLRIKRSDLIKRVTKFEESLKHLDKNKSLPTSNHCNI